MRLNCLPSPIQIATSAGQRAVLNHVSARPALKDDLLGGGDAGRAILFAAAAIVEVPDGVQHFAIEQIENDAHLRMVSQIEGSLRVQENASAESMCTKDSEVRQAGGDLSAVRAFVPRLVNSGTPLGQCSASVGRSQNQRQPAVAVGEPTG